MQTVSIYRRTIFLCSATLIALVSPSANASEIKVVSSGGFAAAYRELAPQFEKATGNKLEAGWGPSMGDTKDSVPSRLKRGEKIDVVIMVGYALDKLANEGKVIPDSRVALARSPIGMVVKKGAKKPDISSVAGLRQALLDAKSIAYSDSASGVYIQNEMFKKLGIEDQVKGKSRMIPADPVAGVVAKGEAELGFQQISELLPELGTDLVGPLPAEVQQITLFSAGVPSDSSQPAIARALINFLSSPQAADAITRSGMEPVHPASK